jgi:excisionase family DNA binding protein
MATLENMSRTTTLREPALLNAQEAAAYLGIGKTSLNKLRREGKLPTVRLITDARYHIDDLNAFIDQCRNNTGKTNEQVPRN